MKKHRIDMNLFYDHDPEVSYGHELSIVLEVESRELLLMSTIENKRCLDNFLIDRVGSIDGFFVSR